MECIGGIVCRPLSIAANRMWVQALACVIVAMCVASPTLAQSGSLNRIVVTVNGEPITETDIERRIRILQFDALQANAAVPSSEQARARAIDTAISQVVKRQGAETMGFVVSDDEIDANIRQMGQQNGMSAAQLMEYFGEQGLSESDVRLVISENILEEIVGRRVLAQRIQVREEEIDRYLRVNDAEFERPEQYNLTLIVIDDAEDLSFTAKRRLRQVTQDIKFEINTGRDFISIASAARQVEGVDAGSLGWVNVGDIEPELLQELSKVTIGQHVGPIKSNDAMIFALVTGHREAGLVELPQIREFHLARLVLHATNEAGAEVITKQLEEIRRNIVSGGDFGSLAKLNSHDDETRSSGGDLGWVPEDNIPFEFLQPLLTMQVGDVSEIQRFGNSVFIFELRGERKGDYEVSKRSAVRDRLRNLKLRNESTKWIDQLKADANIKYRSNF